MQGTSQIAILTGDELQLFLYGSSTGERLCVSEEEGADVLGIETVYHLPCVWRILVRNSGLGEDVLYGSVVQVENKLTGRVLAPTSFLDRRTGCYKLGLLGSEDKSETSYWLVQPGSIVRREGDTVSPGDHFLLVHLISRLALSVDNHSLTCSPAGHPLLVQQLGQYISGSPIRHSDYCVLTNRETGALLSVPLQGDLPVAVHVAPGEPAPLSSWWQLHPTVQLQAEAASSAVPWNTPFRLRHVVSGRYLYCEPPRRAQQQTQRGNALRLDGSDPTLRQHASVAVAYSRKRLPPQLTNELRPGTLDKLEIEFAHLFVPETERAEFEDLTASVRKLMAPRQLTIRNVKQEIPGAGDLFNSQGDRFVMIAYRRGPVAYVREWRQREPIVIPYTLTDSDNKGPFMINARLYIDHARFGVIANSRTHRDVTETFRVIVKGCSMLRLLVVHMSDLPNFGSQHNILDRHLLIIYRIRQYTYIRQFSYDSGVVLPTRGDLDQTDEDNKEVPYPEPQMLEQAGKVTILSAKFGPEGEEHDVTSQVASWFRAAMCVRVFKLTTSFLPEFGDRAPGKVKHLTVCYRVNKTTVTRRIMQDVPFVIPTVQDCQPRPFYSGPLTILDANIGKQSVTAFVESLVTQMSAAVSSALGDTLEESDAASDSDGGDVADDMMARVVRSKYIQLQEGVFDLMCPREKKLFKLVGARPEILRVVYSVGGHVTVRGFDIAKDAIVFPTEEDVQTPCPGLLAEVRVSLAQIRQLPTAGSSFQDNLQKGFLGFQKGIRNLASALQQKKKHEGALVVDKFDDLWPPGTQSLRIHVDAKLPLKHALKVRQSGSLYVRYTIAGVEKKNTYTGEQLVTIPLPEHAKEMSIGLLPLNTPLQVIEPLAVERKQLLYWNAIPIRTGSTTDHIDSSIGLLVQHAKTRYYLHNSDTDGSAKFLGIDAARDKSLDDGWQVQALPMESVASYTRTARYVQTIVRSLTERPKQLANDKRDLDYLVKQAIDPLTRRCKEEGSAVRDMLLAQDLIGIAIRLLEALRSPAPPAPIEAKYRASEDDLIRTATTVVRMLASLVSGSDAAANVMRQHLRLLRSFAAAVCDRDSGVTEVLQGMISSSLVLGRELADDVEFWLRVATRHASATRSVLTVLRALCAPAGVPQHGAQERVGAALESARHKVLRQEYYMEGASAVYVRMSISGVQLALNSNQLAGEGRHQQQLYAAHDAFLRLCISLCRGGHVANQARVAQWIPLAACNRLLEDQDTYPQIVHLKALILRAVRVTFIERETSKLKVARGVTLWEPLDAQKEPVLRTPEVETLTQWVAKTILTKGNPKYPVPTDAGELVLLRYCVRCLASLQSRAQGYELNHSFFHTLLQGLSRILQWNFATEPTIVTAQRANPLVALDTKKSPFILDPVRRRRLINVLNKLKFRICQLFQLVEVQMCEARLVTLHQHYRRFVTPKLKDYDEQRQQLKLAGQRSADLKSGAERQAFIQQQVDEIAQWEEIEAEKLQKAIADEASQLDLFTFQKQTLCHVTGNAEFAPLLDTEMSKVRSSALQLIFGKYGWLERLMSPEAHSQVVTNELYVQLAGNIRAYVATLADMTQSLQKIAENKEEIVRILMRRLFCKLFEVDSSLTYEHVRVSMQTPSAAVQDLMATSGIVDVLFKMMDVPVAIVQQDADLKEQVANCYRFLRYYCMDHFPAKQSLQPYIARMFEHMNNDLLVSWVFAELYQNNPAAVEALSPQQTDALVRLLSPKRPYARIASMLASMCQRDGNGIPDKQEAVARYLLEVSVSVATDPSPRRWPVERHLRGFYDERKIMPLSDEPEAFTVAFVDMLAAVLLQRRFSALLAQLLVAYGPVLGLERCCSVLQHHQVPFMMRSAYWRFITNAYLAATLPVNSEQTLAWVGLMQMADKHLIDALEAPSLSGSQSDFLLGALLPALETMLAANFAPDVLQAQFNEWRSTGESLDTIQSIYPNLAVISSLQSSLQRIAVSLALLRSILPAVFSPRIDAVSSLLRLLRENGILRWEPPPETKRPGADGQVTTRAALPRLTNESDMRASLRFFVEKAKAHFVDELKNKERELVLAVDTMSPSQKMAIFEQTVCCNDPHLSVRMLKLLQQLLRGGVDGEVPLFERQTLFNELKATQAAQQLALIPATQSNALAALRDMLDGGNPEVQKSMSDAVRFGVISPTGQRVPFMSSLAHQLGDTTERLRTNPWWAGGDAAESADPHIEIKLEFLQQLCEGHNTAMQDLLRVHHFGSGSMLNALLRFLKAMMPTTCPETSPATERGFGIIKAALNTLTEALQGPCQGNQAVVLGLNLLTTEASEALLDAARSLGVGTLAAAIEMQTNWERALIESKSDPYIRRLLRATCKERSVARKAAGAVLALLEGPQLERKLDAVLPLLQQPLANKCEAYAELLHRFRRDDELCRRIRNEALDLYVLYRHMTLLVSKSEPSKCPKADAAFVKYIASIEILRRDGRFVATGDTIASTGTGVIVAPPADSSQTAPAADPALRKGEYYERVVFVRGPLSPHLTYGDKEPIMASLGRGSVRETITTFFTRASDLEEALALKKHVQSFLSARILTDSITEVSLRAFCILLILFGNAMMIANTSVNSYQLAQGVQSVSVLLLILYLLRFGAFWALRGRMHRNKQLAAHIREERQKAGIHASGTHSAGGTVSEAEELFGSRATQFLLFRFFILQKEFLFYLVMIGTAAAAIPYPGWLAVHVLDIVLLSSVVKTVLASLVRSAKSLILAIGMIALMNYFYAVIGFKAFPDVFLTDPDDPSSATLCTSVWNCFFYMFFGMPGQKFMPQRFMFSSSTSSAGSGAEFVFQITYYLLVFLALINLTTAIIVNAFAQLREQRQTTALLQRSRCFVCYREGEDEEFHIHRDRQHNLWHFMHFLAALRFKDPRDFTGPEAYVKQRLREGDLSFFPTNNNKSNSGGRRLARSEQQEQDYQRLLKEVVSEATALAAGMDQYDHRRFASIERLSTQAFERVQFYLEQYLVKAKSRRAGIEKEALALDAQIKLEEERKAVEARKPFSRLKNALLRK